MATSCCPSPPACSWRRNRAPCSPTTDSTSCASGRPVRPGDELTVALTAAEINPREGVDYGDVRWDVVVTNQDDTPVASYQLLTLVAKEWNDSNEARASDALRRGAGAGPAARAARLVARRLPQHADPPDRPARPLGDRRHAAGRGVDHPGSVAAPQGDPPRQGPGRGRPRAVPLFGGGDARGRTGRPPRTVARAASRSTRRSSTTRR